MHHSDRTMPAANMASTRPPMDRHAEQLSDIERRFTYHPPRREQLDRYQALRAKAKEMAVLIVETTPYSREQATALTYLDAVLAFADAAIARNE